MKAERSVCTVFIHFSFRNGKIKLYANKVFKAAFGFKTISIKESSRVLPWLVFHRFRAKMNERV